mmetsp:Transcript_24056/g.77630  ORF Transcript_24056/g.77630 Transcript_24056/m.77630 type:complete len:265 (-) Transcript_24056:174-968(-)
MSEGECAQADYSESAVRLTVSDSLLEPELDEDGGGRAVVERRRERRRAGRRERARRAARGGLGHQTRGIEDGDGGRGRADAPARRRLRASAGRRRRRRGAVCLVVLAPPLAGVEHRALRLHRPASLERWPQPPRRLVLAGPAAERGPIHPAIHLARGPLQPGPAVADCAIRPVAGQQRRDLAPLCPVAREALPDDSVLLLAPVQPWVLADGTGWGWARASLVAPQPVPPVASGVCRAAVDVGRHLCPVGAQGGHGREQNAVLSC